MKNWLLIASTFIAFLSGTYAPASSLGYVDLRTDNEHEGTHLGHSVNRPSPIWQLQDTLGQAYSNQTQAHKPYVLVMHLGKGCLQCSQQLRTFSDAADSFEQLGVSVLAISTDDQTVLKDAMAQLDSPLTITMLSDASLKTFKSFRAFDTFKDKALHATIFIDAQGDIRWQNVGEHPFTDTSALLQTITTVANQEAEQAQEVDSRRPTIFFNRSPRIMDFQLSRLDTERLLLVERTNDDKKYVPVFREILARDGISPRLRDEAISALVKLNDSNPAEELLGAINKLELKAKKLSKSKRKNAKNDIENITKAKQQLLNSLWRQPQDVLSGQASNFEAAIASKDRFQQSMGYAGLISGGQSDQAWNTAKQKNHTKEWLDAVSLVPESLRAAERPRVVGLIDNKDEPTGQAALTTLSLIPFEQEDTFRIAAQTIRQAKMRPIAVNTLLKVPTAARDSKLSAELADFLVQYAESAKPKERTEDPFLDAMQLVDQLMVSVPNEQAKAYRKRLARVTVRIVKINTIVDEMRYDVPYFAVEAGSRVQIVFNNDDFMAHNVVITRTGKLKEIAELGGRAGPQASYLPSDRSDILQATKMVDANKQAKMTFKAPQEVGEYPYVCTFPQHWSRMYGVMVVVKDLDAWLKNPVKPTDPIGNTRTQVAEWTVDDLKDELATGVRETTDAVGAQIYTEATCAQCHQISGKGGKVGPALDAVFSRHKNDRTAILREILEPSHFIDKQYQQHKILTIDNLTITGIIKSRTDKEIKLLVNPESGELTTVLVDDIEQMAVASQSIMPKGLMNNFTKEEIFELMDYLERGQSDDSN